MILQPPHALAWLRQRLAGDAAVAEIEDAGLRALGPVEALALSEALLAAVPLEGPGIEARRLTSGIVEQQRLFHRKRG